MQGGGKCSCGYDLRDVPAPMLSNIIRCPQCGEVYILCPNLFNEVEILSIK